MTETPKPFCPECEEPREDLISPDRRDFMRSVGQGAAALLAVGGLAASARTAHADPLIIRSRVRAEKPAETLVKELFSTLSDDQKEKLVLPWDHRAGGRVTRLGMYNSPILGRQIGELYTKAQQELIERILRAISAGDDGYRRISRGGTWDGSGALRNCGALIFGSPEDGKKFSWVFTGHHLTVRCDGNSEEGAAFGGPMYYGHSPNGYSEKNLFNYQTKSVLSVFDALSEKQQKQAIAPGSPGEQAGSVQFRPAGQAKPGISTADLDNEQRALVEKVMRDILSPYRKEDADEVMEIVKTNGGMEKIHLAFYQDARMNDNQPWHFWRLEGPGFVWNYRVLPHVHTYVNIAARPGKV